jgi:tRNA modification GTPase
LDALRRTGEHLHGAMEAYSQGRPLDLVAEDLRLAQHSLGEITGAVSSDDLLGRIFSEFCIGK